MTRALLFASFSIATLLIAGAQNGPENKNSAQITYQQFTLDNGLQVLLHEDHKLPLVAVDLWYHVGPLEERARRTGFAHLFEHMMFEGSKHVGEKAHFKYVEGAGGTDINGTTAWDRTDYFETMPSNQLELALWLESDRMGFLLDTLDRAKLTNQRDVVRNERRQGLEGQPYGLVNEEVYHQLFPKGHPYYAAVIGSHADIESARLQDVREFFKDFYCPNNATLAIAGDYDPATIKSQLEKYFGPIPRGPEVKPGAVATPPITREKRVTVTDAVQLPKVILAWLTPHALAPGDAEMNIASNVLGSGKSSRLYRELVYKQQIAQSATCTEEDAALSSNMQCELVAKPGITPEKLEAEAEKVIDGFAASGPTAEELEWSRNKIETQIISGLERLGGFGGVADQLNYYNQYAGDPGYLPKDLARYDAVTPEAVLKVAAQTLGKEQRVVIYGVPGKKMLNDVPRSPQDSDATVKIKPEYTAEFEAAQAWRATAPKPGPQHALALPKPEVFTLDNGMTVFLVERHELPIVSAQFVTIAGTGANPPDHPGLAGTTAAMLSEGTTSRSAEEIAKAAALLGTDLNVSSGPDTAQIGISLLSRYVGRGVELMADAARHPSFPADDLERVRKERLTSLIQRQDVPFQLGIRTGVLNLFGKTNPYGYDELGTEDSLKSISRDNVAQFYAAHYGPKSSLLELTGDLTPEQARQLAEKAFGDWSSAAESPSLPHAPEAPQRKVLVVDKPGAPQTALLTFGVGVARNAPDYPALTVMNTMLGGLFSSRINMNLREQHGYTYGAFSFYWYYRGTGPFIAGAEVRADVTAPAAEQLFHELQAIHTQPLTEAELRMSKDSIIRSLPGSFESAGAVNQQLNDLWLFRLPPDYFAQLPGQIEAVTSKDVQQAADRYVHPDNVLLVAVGDRAKIEPGLKSLNLGPVEAWKGDEKAASAQR
ncbi:M16 family metallopeptidase [Occallatibacter savannae]|uniref:M16 family metallopeptidase n=1 Tax=Occallatibacter savannae TaxID=1002691 RepID=UPI000D6990C8|nr:pitrilysin family protein [Occallatibacter savannae]